MAETEPAEARNSAQRWSRWPRSPLSGCAYVGIIFADLLVFSVNKLFLEAP